MRIFFLTLASLVCLASCQKLSSSSPSSLDVEKNREGGEKHQRPSSSFHLPPLKVEESELSRSSSGQHRLEKRQLGMAGNNGMLSHGMSNGMAGNNGMLGHGMGGGMVNPACLPGTNVAISGILPAAQAAAIVQQPIIEPALFEAPIIQRIIQPILQRVEQQRILQPIVQPMELPTIVKAAFVEPTAVEAGAMSEAVMLQTAFNPGQYQQNIVEPTINKPSIYQAVVQPVIQPVEQERILQPIVETFQKAPIVKPTIVEPMHMAPTQVAQVHPVGTAVVSGPLPTSGMSKGLTGPAALGMASPQMAAAVQGTRPSPAAAAMYRRRYRKEESFDDDDMNEGITLF